jgi:hypothetical protein
VRLLIFGEPRPVIEPLLPLERPVTGFGPVPPCQGQLRYRRP